MKTKAFTLIEMMVVIGIISMLMAILLPSLGLAREKARIVVAHAELYGISVALEAYATNNNGKYPPTRADCNPDARAHAFAIPQELVDKGYLPKGGGSGKIHWTSIEDEFNPGRTYKYISVGPRYDFYGTPFLNQPLYIPRGYPHHRSGEELKKYTDPEKSPVLWALFSVGPRHNDNKVEQGNFPLKRGFPLLEKFFYSTQSRSGILTRIKMENGRHIGTFR